MAGDWILAWPVVGLLGVLATVRGRRFVAPMQLRRPLWLGAAALAAAVLLRHATDCLVEAAAEAPWSEALIGGADLADGVFFAALVLLLLGLRSTLSGSGSVLTSVACFGAAPVLWLLVRSTGRLHLPLPGDGRLDAALQLLPLCAALAWLPVLAGPSALRLLPERRLAHRLLPQAVVLVCLAGLPLLLLALQGAVRLEQGGELSLGMLGRRELGIWGWRTAAGFEAGASLLAAPVVLVLAVRSVGGSAPAGVGASRLIATSVASMVLAAQLPLAFLLPAAAAVGWAAVAAGSGEAMEGEAAL